MATDPDTAPREPAPGGGGRAWIRPAALVVSCLIIGFVAGWVLRGDDGPVTVLAPAPEQGAGAGATSGETATAPSAGGTTAATTGTAPEAPVEPPERSEIQLAVLNGTSVTGQAAQTAAQAESLGYTGVSAGNAPATSDPTTVYYRQGEEAAADRVATDLAIEAVRPLPASGALSSAAPADAEVVVVLGTG